MGVNHYEKFYELLRKMIADLDKGNYEKILKNVYDVLGYDIMAFEIFNALANYIENEVRERLEKDNVEVSIEPDDEYRYHRITVTYLVRFGLSVKKIIVYESDAFEWGKIADNPKEFNELIEYIIDSIVEEINEINKHIK